MQRISRHKLASLAAMAAVVGTLTFASFGSAPAGAITPPIPIGPIPLFNTTTSVAIATTPSPLRDGEAASLAISVTVTGLNVNLFGSGTISFAEYFPDGTLADSFSDPLGPCAVVTDSCTLNVSFTSGGAPLDNPPGTYTITASYSGGTLSKPSSGSGTYVLLPEVFS
jgi:hypothetical protein